MTFMVSDLQYTCKYKAYNTKVIVVKSENGVIPKQLIPVQIEAAWHMSDILWKFQAKWMSFGLKLLRDCLKRPILTRVHCSVICGWGVFIWAPIAK